MQLLLPSQSITWRLAHEQLRHPPHSWTRWGSKFVQVGGGGWSLVHHTRYHPPLPAARSHIYKATLVAGGTNSRRQGGLIWVTDPPWPPELDGAVGRTLTGPEADWLVKDGGWFGGCSPGIKRQEQGL
mmetsp:Transcript_60366/g.124072  ORF Transcript_60366/g.124072 Transcript_60366/m.124072 type:complete len:128 (-) Transcript_60366:486-869(-)